MGSIKRGSILAEKSSAYAMDALSKAHLIDLAYGLAARLSSSCDDEQAVQAVLAEESAVVTLYRNDIDFATALRRRANRPRLESRL